MGRARTVENIVYGGAHTKQQQHVISAPGETGRERKEGREEGGRGCDLQELGGQSWNRNPIKAGAIKAQQAAEATPA